MIIYHCCCYVLSLFFFCLLWGDGGLGMGEGVKFIYYLLPPWQNQVMFLVTLDIKTRGSPVQFTYS